MQWREEELKCQDFRTAKDEPAVRRRSASHLSKSGKADPITRPGEMFLLGLRALHSRTFACARAPPLPMLALDGPKQVDRKSFAERQKWRGHVQPKLDGWRCIADLKTGDLYTRKGNQYNAGTALKADLLKLNVGHGVQFVDGELMHSKGRDFIRRGLTEGGAGDLRLHVFDCVDDPGRFSFEERLGALRAAFERAALAQHSPLEMVPTHTIDSWVSEKCSFEDLVEKAIPGIKEDFMRKYGQDVCEGVMLRLYIGEDDIYTSLDLAANHC